MDGGTHVREKVSVIMPTYNSQRTVDRAIDSVLGQTHTDWELIIVDDASTDGTVQKVMEQCRGLRDKTVLVRCEENGGPAAARNRGLAMCGGQWIAVLDSDDAWRADRLGYLLTKARQASADAVCDNLLGFDDHLAAETGPLYSRLPAWLDIAAAVAPTYAGTYDLGYLKPVVRRAFVEQHHMRYDEGLRTGEDLLYLLSLLIHGAKIMCVDTPLYIYTTPVGGISRRLSRSTKSAPRDVDMARSLARIREFGPSLTEEERQAIDQRIAHLQHIAPLAEFRYARLQRNWLNAMSLIFASSAVRTRVWGNVRERLGLRRSK